MVYSAKSTAIMWQNQQQSYGKINSNHVEIERRALFRMDPKGESDATWEGDE